MRSKLSIPCRAVSYQNMRTTCISRMPVLARRCSTFVPRAGASLHTLPDAHETKAFHYVHMHIVTGAEGHSCSVPFCRACCRRSHPAKSSARPAGSSSSLNSQWRDTRIYKTCQCMALALNQFIPCPSCCSASSSHPTPLLPSETTHATWKRRGHSPPRLPRSQAS